MNNHPNPELPPDDPGPDDADLVAYLDGELDAPDAHAVESKLALDALARAKADAYKKTYDLLDYLPRPEPSADFATRTLTRLQPVVEGNSSTSRPVTIPSSHSFQPTAFPTRSWPIWLRGAVWSVVGFAVLASGYGAHAGFRSLVREPDELAFSDVHVIENLALYVGVDDLDFLRQLDDPDLFGVDPLRGLAEVSAIRRAETGVANRDGLIALFKSYPPARQQQLRQLDQQLTELPPPDRVQLVRVMENYAVWLNRLADADRTKVLAASSPSERLEEIRQIRERIWREGLPLQYQKKLKLVADQEERLRLIASWKQAEQTRRGEWSLARRQRNELTVGKDTRPWPFGVPGLAEEVDDFIKSVLKADLTMRLDFKGDLPPSCRLTREEFVELKFRHDAAVREGYWMLYGAGLLRLAQRHPGLPEPVGKPPITDQQHLVAEVGKDPKFRKVLAEMRKGQVRGKWPDFALEVATLMQKANHTLPEPLGPCRPGQFAPKLEAFLSGELLPALTPTERDALSNLGGKWPEYPKAMIDLAKKHDLSVPSVTLPGKPSLWAKYYATPTATSSP